MNRENREMEFGKNTKTLDQHEFGLKGYHDTFDDALDELDQSEFSNDEKRAVAKRAAAYYIANRDGFHYFSNVLIEHYKFTEEDMREVLHAAQILALKQGDLSTMKYLENAYSTRALEIDPSSPEIQQAAREGVIHVIKQGYFLGRADDIVKFFGIDKDFFSSEEAVKAAHEGILNAFADGSRKDAKELAKRFSIDKSFFDSAEVKNASQEGFINSLREGDFYTFKKAKKLMLSDEFLGSDIVREAAEQGFIVLLQKHQIHDSAYYSQIVEALDDLLPNKDFFDTEIVRKTIQEYIKWIERTQAKYYPDKGKQSLEQLNSFIKHFNIRLDS